MRPLELEDAIKRLQFLESPQAKRMFIDAQRLEQMEVCLGPVLAYFEGTDFGDWKVRNARVMSIGVICGHQR